MKNFLLIISFIFLITFPLYSEFISISNSYIEILGETESGRFVIKTTGGHPEFESDRNSLLIYKDDPPTSYTTLRIDDQNYIFGEEKGEFISPMKITDNGIEAVWKIKNIIIKQNINLAYGPISGVKDSAGIVYTIINKDDHSHKIGIRVVLDICLGDEDGSPFILPGLGEIVNETLLEKDNISNYWYAYDDLVNPKVMVQGTLKAYPLPGPDRVLFACHERFIKYEWNFKVDPERNFRRSYIGPLDSSLAIYWNERLIKAKESFNTKTFYGIYHPLMFKGKLFTISLNRPRKTEGEPFEIDIGIQNHSPHDIKDVIVQIELPQGLAVQKGDTAIKKFENISSGSIKHTSWVLLPDKKKDGLIDFRINIKGLINDQEYSKAITNYIIYQKESKSLILDLKAKPEIFSPDSDDINDKLFISMFCSENEQIKNWDLNIYPVADNKKGDLFTSFSGSEIPVEPVIWDGRNAAGELIESTADFMLEWSIEETTGRVNLLKEYFKTDIFVIKTPYGFKIQADNVPFEYNKDKLTEDSKKVIDNVIAVLKKYPLYNITVVGHTDNTGSKEFNQKLSEARADSVFRYLASHGVEKERLTRKGVNFSQPLLSNETEEGKARNRRVEFLLEKPKEE
ncbi:MAG: OmpA family protein [Spirochaetes bacterium]|nr:OmpA family protein [Spirochaetota bacterium]